LTGNGNDGNIAGTLSAGFGPSAYITNAAYFDGGEAIDLSQYANSNLLNFTGPITIEAWVQPSSANMFADAVAKGYDSSTYDEICLRVNGPYGQNYYGSSGSVGINGGIQATNWTYMVMSSDGTSNLLYENGILVAQAPDTSGSIQFYDDWVIGDGSSAGASRTWVGGISEVALYNYGLTPAQVVNHYYYGLLNSSASTSAPIINVQPQGQQSYVGGSATFSVVTVSTLPTTNQWYFGNTPLAGQTGTSLTLNNLQLANGGNYSVVIGNANGTTNSVAVPLNVAVPNHLQWTPNGNNGQWDVDTSANWLNVSNDTQTVFNQGDNVLFDDTPGVPTSVTVDGTIYPSFITVNTSNNSFDIASGTISGSGSLLKEGTSPLTISSAGNFTGSATIGGGSLYAGNNCLKSISAITVSNGATLDFGGGTFNSVMPTSVGGTGLNGEGALYNSYNDDPAESLNITLTADTLFAGTARWDLASGSEISGPHNLTVDWSNAGGYGQWNGVTIGANVPQITVTNGGSLGMTAMDNSCQNPATVFNISTNGSLTLYSGGFNGSFNLYNNVQMIDYNGNTTLGGSTIHFYSGVTVSLYGAGIAMTGNSLTLENGVTIISYYNSGNNPVNNAVTLNGLVHFVLGDHNESYSNVVSGVGGFVLDYYNSEIVFSSSNTYTGPTVIGSSGNSPEVALSGNGSITHSSLIFFGGDDPTVAHFNVSGRSDQTLTLASGQTLEGVGGVNGNLVLDSGAVLSPGGTNTTDGITTGSNPTGEIAASGNVALGGTTVIKLDGTTNDVVQAGGSLTYGGTLNLANISGTALAAGNSFQIFNAATYSGSFSGITPATPGAGLSWNTSQLLSSGVISVSGSSGAVISSTSLSGTNLVFSGSGGTPNGSYYVLSTTNLLTGPWITNTSGSFGPTGNFSVTNPIVHEMPQQFYLLKY
jgi:fibronectin-binding autotransporter adhesin